MKKSRANLKKLVGELLFPMGFESSSSAFFRQRNDFIQIIDVDRSRYSGSVNYIRPYLYYSPTCTTRYSFARDQFNVLVLCDQDLQDGSSQLTETNGADIDGDEWKGSLSTSLSSMVQALECASSIDSIAEGHCKEIERVKIVPLASFKDRPGQA